MRISTAWLSEWVDTGLQPGELAERLTSLGLEVDSIESLGEGFEDVVVGEVLEVNAHPNADRLSLCRVAVGRDDPLNIVCGAPNVSAGCRYPTALVGATLPGGLQIRRTKIRGEYSEGMLCSAAELRLGESADGILELDEGLRVGEPIVSALNLDDTIIDVDLTPNRADCFSMMGVARDLAAGLGADFKTQTILPVLGASDAKIDIRLQDPAGCPRFVGRVIHDLNSAAETPQWMQDRLTRAGVRPIHPVVDVTNYVMLELGQPMHAYDLDRLDGGLVARRGHAGESVELLDGQQVTVNEDVLVIADDAGAVGLAGIMGGARTAVHDGTHNVCLEAAFFSPATIAGRARRFGLHTDASARFERGVDPLHQTRAIERATALLQAIAGGQAGPVIEAESREHLPQRQPVRLRRERLSLLLGAEVPDTEVRDIFARLDMQVSDRDDGWEVLAPSARFDIEREVDLIEEVARIHGYDRIPETVGAASGDLGSATESCAPLERARLQLVARGYQEAVTFSFIDPELERSFTGGPVGLPLSNPISAALSVMRQSLWPGLALAARYNLQRQQERVRLFETGVRFLRHGDAVDENRVIAGIAVGNRWPEQWDGDDRSVDVFDIKSDVLALAALSGKPTEFAAVPADHPALRPGRAAQVHRNGAAIGWFGEMHPALAQHLEMNSAPLLFELEIEPLLASTPPAYAGVSRFPAVRRDLAPVIPESVPAGDLLAGVRRAAGALLKDLILFDLYTGEKVETGSKSVSLGLILQDTSRTLTDADVDGVMHDVMESLRRDFNATIRE